MGTEPFPQLRSGHADGFWVLKKKVGVLGKIRLECVGRTFAHAHKTFARRRTRSPAFASKSLVTSITRYQRRPRLWRNITAASSPQKCSTVRIENWTEPRRELPLEQMGQAGIKPRSRIKGEPPLTALISLRLASFWETARSLTITVENPDSFHLKVFRHELFLSVLETWVEWRNSRIQNINLLFFVTYYQHPQKCAESPADLQTLTPVVHKDLDVFCPMGVHVLNIFG